MQRNKNRSLNVATHGNQPTGKSSVEFKGERLSHSTPQQRLGGCDAANEVQQREKHERDTLASSEIVKLIRKLRWAGLEEKAKQLENELEKHTVADTVVSIQNETD